MTKFEIGDKVRILYTSGAPLAGFDVGDIVEIYESKFDGSKSGGLAEFSVVKDNGTCGHCDEIHIEKVSQSPTKNQRLSALEQQVAELQAEVATLKSYPKPTEIAEMFALAQLKAQKPTLHIGKASVHITQETPKLSANEQRKAIIAEAKAFVERKTHYLQDSSRCDGGFGAKKRENPNLCGAVTKCDFVVNAEKRTVVALVKYPDNSLRTKGIAKCAPDDVFNADIGKASALGRALGLDVKRFEQAVKPTEVVVGTVVTKFKNANIGLRQTVTEIITDRNTAHFGGGKAFNTKEYGGWLAEGQVAITDDTGAQY